MGDNSPEKSNLKNGAASGRGGTRTGAGRKPDEFKRMFDQAISKVVTAAEAEAVVRSLLTEAKSGNVKAQTVLLDRILGKVPQGVQLAGDAGGPIEIIVTYGSNTK